MSLSLPTTGSKPGLVESGLLTRFAYIAVFLFPVMAVVMLPFLAIPIVFILVVRFGAVRVRSSGAFGTARFAEFDDFQKAGMLGLSGLILGRVFGKRASLYHAVKRLFTAPLAESREVCTYLRYAIRGKRGPETHLIRLRKSVHGVVVAPPGAGKGIGFVIPNLLSHPGSVVVIDPKGENFLVTNKVRKRLKNRVIRLDPFRVCGPGGARFNPLIHIDPASPLFGDQCKAIAESLVVRTGREQEDHWNDASEMGITGCLMYVIVYACPDDRNLNAVADLLTDPDAFAGMVAMMRDVNGDLESACSHTHAYKLLKRYGNTMASWEDRELSSIRSSIGRHMSWLHSPVVEDQLSQQSDFDPQDLVRGDVTVYMILPPKYLSTLSRLLRLWVTSLYGSITEYGAQEDREVLFMLDESGSLGPLPALYSAIVLGRGYGLRVWLILQSISQLKSLFPKDGDHQTVEAAIDHKMFFGVRDYATAEMVSNYSGTTTISVTSHTKSRGSTTSGGGIFSSEKYSRSTNEGTSETRSETGRKLLMPDEILQLPADLAVILTKGVPPILAGLAKYYETPELAYAWPYVGKAKKEVRAIA